MRSSNRRSTPAWGDGTHGISSVAITIRQEKSALTSSFDIAGSSKAFGEWSQIHLVCPGRRMLRCQLQVGTGHKVGLYSRRLRRAESLICLSFVDQSVENDMRDTTAFGAELTRERLREAAKGKFRRCER